MHIIFEKITKNFKKENILYKDVANLLEMNGCLDTIRHASAVADEARILATRFSENQESAFSAGWLHDVSVVFPDEDKVRIATELGIAILPEEKIFPNILHQKISEVAAERIFGITDKNILSAIGCHTTLRENASVLDKIVFVADKIRWDKEYSAPYLQDVLTALKKTSLDEACFYYLDYLWQNRENLAVVHPWMEAAYKQLLTKRKMG